MGTLAKRRKNSQGVVKGGHITIAIILYSGTSGKRTHWEWAFCPLYRGCLYRSGDKVDP